MSWKISGLNTFTCVAACNVLAISFIMFVTLHDVMVCFTLVANLCVCRIFADWNLRAFLGALIFLPLVMRCYGSILLG